MARWAMTLAGVMGWVGAATGTWAADTSGSRGPPQYFPVPATAHVDVAGAVYESFGETEFPLVNGEDPVLKQGHHHHFDLKVAGLPDGTPFQKTWRVLGPTLASGGWTTVLEGNGFYTIRYQKDDKDAWAVIGIFGPDDIRVDLVETSPPPGGFSVPTPSPKGEPAARNDGDFPLIPPLPGSHRTGGDHSPDPMLVSLPGDEQPEEVSSGSTTKEYEGPQTLSNLETITRYQNALTAVGWSIALRVEGVRSSDGVLVAHYAKGERNLWVSVHSAGTGYSLQLSDEGAPDELATGLQKNCHVALTGVLFDFNKATLKPESTPVLQRVLAIAAHAPELKLEVQGHTDNVGDDDYNLRLSRARAAAVRDWLVANGVAGSRLGVNGYGKARPVASNDDDNGRAKNRRVEIARPDCAH